MLNVVKYYLATDGCDFVMTFGHPLVILYHIIHIKGKGFDYWI